VTTEVISAPWVLPGRPDAAGTPPVAIRDGAVAFQGDTVVAVGKRPEIEARHGAGERIDGILLPALVNAHLHLELSHLAGMVPGGEGLAGWIGRFVATRAALRASGAAEAMAAGARQLRKAGVAAVGDVSNALSSLEPLSHAGICGTVFHEVLGFSPERFEHYLVAARAERGVRPVSRGLRVLESPHAVYSTNRDGLWALLRAGPCSIHLAEDPGEREFCRGGTGPFRRLLEDLGATDIDALRVQGRSSVAAAVEAGGHGPGRLAVHCVDLDPRDVELLAASGATAVLCPRSNRHISGLLPPLPALLEAGVPLAVGTDSLASSPSLSPLAELALLHREFPAVASSRLVALAWNGPAVGAVHVGRLAPGAAPGVVAAPLAGARPDDPFAYLLGAFGADERPLGWIRPNAMEARP